MIEMMNKFMTYFHGEKYCKKKRTTLKLLMKDIFKKGY